MAFFLIQYAYLSDLFNVGAGLERAIALAVFLFFINLVAIIGGLTLVFYLLF